MDKNAVDSLVISFDTLDYTNKLSAYNKTFSLGRFSSDDMNDKLVLISLVALANQKIKEKDATMTPLKLLMSITGQVKDNSGFYQFLESLSIIVEDLSYGCKKIDPCGMKTSQEIINKIKEILDTWLPF
jgi:hypothetical protein